MLLDIRGLPDSQARAHVARRLTATLARRHIAPVRATIGFSDENGPKGGPALRCTVTVQLPYRRAVHVEHRAQTPRAAFDGAFATLVQDLMRCVEHGRESRRYPRKYYAAKRLLRAAPARPPDGNT